MLNLFQLLKALISLIKTNCSVSATLVDPYTAPPQLTQDRKFQSKPMLPANKLSHMQNQPKTQNITGQQQNELRVVEEPKPTETIECINVGTQKTAEKMRKDEGM